MDYDVSKLKDTLRTTDILLFSGDRDSFSQPQDVAALTPLLPEGKWTNVAVPDYGHCDYMWAEDIDVTVSPKLLEFVGKAAQAN